MISTKIFQAESHVDDGNSPVLLDLEPSYGSLHQSTISSDDRYLLVVLPEGQNANFPDQRILTIDLVEKQVVHRNVNKDRNEPVLTAIPC
mmetsp:Transcript_52182/g.111603  ORF Transcript_52182/g.111603 Transcript_52182/m.111603 type:complete len:90 (+) Transcript_52182:544-813(+)